MTVVKAIRIGELLAGEKAKLKHGGWLKWISANLEFNQRTARRYIELFRYRVEIEKHLKSDSVTDFDLNSAYCLIDIAKRYNRPRVSLPYSPPKSLPPMSKPLPPQSDSEPILIPNLPFERRCELFWQTVDYSLKAQFEKGERLAVREFLARRLEFILRQLERIAS
jgi:hypothetical protein